MSESQIPEQFAPEKLEKYPVWTCQLESLGQEFAALEKWTVGEKYRLACKGPDKLPFVEPVKILFPQEELSYTLVILQTLRNEAAAAEFMVTGYKAGGFKAPLLLLTDQKQNVRVENLEWQVHTVVEQKQGEKVEPYPLFGPFTLAWPLWVYAVLVGIGFLLLGFIYWLFRKNAKRKKLIEDLEQYTSALSPYNAFNKEIRQILRKYEGKSDKTLLPQYIKDLDETFRLYLIRQLKVPAFAWTVAEILREIKRRQKTLYRAHARDIRDLLSELDKAKIVAQNLHFQDCDQIRDISRRIVNHIHSMEKELQ